MLSTWLRIEAGVIVLFAQPVILPEEGVHVQVKRVPGTLVVRLIFVELPWQIPLDRGLLERSGVGFTATV